MKNPITAVENVVDSYVKLGQMFTVYQIWYQLEHDGEKIPYSFVRQEVENLIDDYHSDIPGWTRSVGNHLKGLDNTVGKSGEPPQVYHPVGADITKYDPDFRLYAVPAKNLVQTRPQSLVDGLVQLAVNTLQGTNVRSVKSIPKAVGLDSFQNRGKAGLFQFKVWYNGQLIDCNLIHERNGKGHFVKANPGEAVGYFPNGFTVKVKQDAEGKLYAVKV